MRSLCVLGLVSLALSANQETHYLSKPPVQPPRGSHEAFGVLRDRHNWYVQNINKNQIYKVPNHEVDASIRDIKPEHLHNFAQSGDNYLVIDQNDDGTYKVRSKSRLQASGPVSGAIGYWTVKAVGYAVPAVGGTTLAYQAFKAMGTEEQPWEIDVQNKGSRDSIRRGISIASRPTDATTGVTQASNAIVAAGQHEKSAEVTATLAVAGLWSSYIGYVEGAATAVGSALGSIPFLP